MSPNREGPCRATARTLVAALALAAALATLSVPHGHADPSAERSCTACQVVRTGGASVEPLGTVAVPEPPLVASRAQAAIPGAPPARARLQPFPPRGPPPASRAS